MERVVRFVGSGHANVLGGAGSHMASRFAHSARRRKGRSRDCANDNEKVAALAEAQIAAMTAVLKGNKKHRVAKKALGVYAKRVGRNRRRLSK